MKRTTVFLDDDLQRLLRETARRTSRPQAEVVREALATYLHARPRPWPRSIGMGRSHDHTVTSENVKEWVRDQWRHEIDGSVDAGASSPEC